MLKFSGLAGLSSCFEKKQCKQSSIEMQSLQHEPLMIQKGLAAKATNLDWVSDKHASYLLHVSQAKELVTHKACRSQAWLSHGIAQ